MPVINMQIGILLTEKEGKMGVSLKK